MVLRYLKNEKLIGYWADSRCLEPVITDERFYAIQQLIKERSKKMSPQQNHKLAGLVKCLCCQKKDGDRYSYAIVRNKTKFVYFRCAGYGRFGRPYCPESKLLPEPVLNYVYDQNVHIAKSRIMQREIDHKASKELIVVDGKLEKLNERMELLIDDLDNARGKVRERIQQRLNALEDERKTLLAEKGGLTKRFTGDLSALVFGGNLNAAFQLIDFKINVKGWSIECEGEHYNYHGYDRGKGVYRLNDIEIPGHSKELSTTESVARQV